MATFITYSRSDAGIALQVASYLKSRGSDVWIDQLDIPSGTHWDSAVESALKRCEAVLVLLSPHAVQSPHVLDEIAFALDNQKTVLPVLLGSCEKPLRLHRLQHIDFRAGDQKTLDQICERIARPTDAMSSCDSAQVVAEVKSSSQAPIATLALDATPKNRPQRIPIPVTHKADIQLTSQPRSTWLDVQGRQFLAMWIALAVCAGGVVWYFYGTGAGLLASFAGGLWGLLAADEISNMRGPWLKRLIMLPVSVACFYIYHRFLALPGN